MATPVHANRKIVSGDHGRTGRMFLQQYYKEGSLGPIPLHTSFATIPGNSGDFEESEPTELIVLDMTYREQTHKVTEFMSNRSGLLNAVHCITAGRKAVISLKGIWDASINYSGYTDSNIDFRVGNYFYAEFFPNADRTKTLEEMENSECPRFASFSNVITEVIISVPAKGKLLFDLTFKSSGFVDISGDGSVDDDEFSD